MPAAAAIAAATAVQVATGTVGAGAGERDGAKLAHLTQALAGLAATRTATPRTGSPGHSSGWRGARGRGRGGRGMRPSPTSTGPGARSPERGSPKSPGERERLRVRVRGGRGRGRGAGYTRSLESASRERVQHITELLTSMKPAARRSLPAPACYPSPCASHSSAHAPTFELSAPHASVAASHTGLGAVTAATAAAVPRAGCTSATTRVQRAAGAHRSSDAPGCVCDRALPHKEGATAAGGACRIWHARHQAGEW